MSQLNVDTIKKAAGTGNLSVPAETGTVVTTASPSLGRRNLIINGAYTIWQRATTSSSNGVSTADRWQQNDATFTQETGIVPDNFQYSMKVVANGSGTPLLLQKIERPQVCGHVLNQDITVSFYARSSNVNAITKLELNDEGGSGGRPDGGAQTLSAADTWERITHTFTAPFSSLTGNSVAVILTFATSATVYISGFQVEVGSVATPFEHISYGESLAACQRYFLRAGYGGNVIGAYTTASRIDATIHFPVTMRSAPTMSATSGTNYWYAYTNGTVDNFDNWSGAAGSSLNFGSMYASHGQISGPSSGGCQVQFNNSNAYFQADAEL